MVFFTCNHCGESVKKPAVEKHYKMICRKPVFVSCMDCLKDFREDYVEHTKCITEAEKYSGKDYVPKESKNTGLKKQESWLEIVRSVLSTNEYEVTPQVRDIFQRLESYDNVPRKKAKFENFVSNSMRVRKDQAEAVWNVLEKALEKLKAARGAEVSKAENNDSVSTENGKNEEEKVEDVQNGIHTEEEVKTPIKDKKKSKKKRLEESTNSNSVPEVNQDEPAKKKKKKNKESANEVTLTNNKEEDTSESVPKKEKSKKKGRVEENGNVEISPCEEDHKETAENLISPGNKGTNGTCESTTKNIKNLADGTPVDSKKNKEKVGDFNWKEVILKILSKNNDGISIEKLKTKVIKKYKARHQVEEITKKVERTFNKKLRKSGLLIHNDIVKINVK